MGQVSVRDGVLHIGLTVTEHLLALHGHDIDVPLSEIAAAVAVPDVLAEVRGLRMPGAGVPGVIAIGTWRGRDDDEPFHDFVLVHRKGPGVMVTVTGGDYDRILLGVDDPAGLVAELTA